MPLLANLGPKDSLGELPSTDPAATVKGVPEVQAIGQATGHYN